MLELVDEEGATHLDQNWDEEHFEGNSGIIKLNKANCTGLVKFVYDDITEDFIEEEINQNYPTITKTELFRNKDEEFTGMIKVVFKDEVDLNNAIAAKFTIGNRKYIIEPFIYKPKVIKCNTCQRFGHVSRLCRAKNKPVCGKCCQNHETKNCRTNEDEYKCYHCSKTDHTSGSHSCEKYKEKLQELMDRYNG